MKQQNFFLFFVFTLNLYRGAFPAQASSNTRDLDGKIINGTMASLMATKHQVSIRRKAIDEYFFGTGHICGGSLIAPNVVLSAAHCFVDQHITNGTFLPQTDFIAVMGNLDRFEKNDQTLVIDISKIFYDLSFFNVTTFEKDIALLILRDSVPAKHPTVKPIPVNRHALEAQTICQATGWGRTEDGNISEVLKTVDLPIIDIWACSNETLFSPDSMREGMICAGYLDIGERDACVGDSGGPLVCDKLLCGIVSWGSGCALPKLPGVYTEVAYWAPWIDARLKEENITLVVDTVDEENDGEENGIENGVYYTNRSTRLGNGTESIAKYLINSFHFIYLLNLVNFH